MRLWGRTGKVESKYLSHCATSSRLESILDGRMYVDLDSLMEKQIAIKQL